MIVVTDQNRIAFERGFLCPKCGSSTNTYRHMYAERWCPTCGFILRKEGDTSSYDYREHLTED